MSTLLYHFSTLFCLAVLFLNSCEEKKDDIEKKDVMYTLGANKYGVLGNGTDVDNFTPLLVSGIRNAIDIQAREAISMTLLSNGKVLVWGDNISGQLGTGETSEAVYSPVLVRGIPEITKISTGGSSCLALDKNGKVWFWGSIHKNHDQEPLIANYAPTKMNTLPRIIDIACGSYHCLAVDTAGYVWSWGWNINGSLGDGTLTGRAIPKRIENISNIKKVSAGYFVSMAISNEGNVYSWGYNSHYELGQGYMPSTPLIPTRIQNLKDVIDIKCGRSHVLCLTTNGQIYGWGEGGSGQLGTGQRNDASTPLLITRVTNIKDIYASGNSSMALTKGGSVYVWGNYKFQSEDYGFGGYNVYVPTLMSCLIGAKKIACGGFHYMVIMKDESLSSNDSCFEPYSY